MGILFGNPLAIIRFSIDNIRVPGLETYYCTGILSMDSAKISVINFEYQGLKGRFYVSKYIHNVC